jgi:hypothetical protein
MPQPQHTISLTTQISQTNPCHTFAMDKTHMKEKPKIQKYSRSRFQAFATEYPKYQKK